MTAQGQGKCRETQVSSQNENPWFPALHFWDSGRGRISFWRATWHLSFFLASGRARLGLGLQMQAGKEQGEDGSPGSGGCPTAIFDNRSRPVSRAQFVRLSCWPIFIPAYHWTNYKNSFSLVLKKKKKKGRVCVYFLCLSASSPGWEAFQRSCFVTPLGPHPVACRETGQNIAVVSRWTFSGVQCVYVF